jgi:serine/threonine protein kinase
VIDDRYRIVEVLGEGGMGAVYVAEHLKLRKQVALKTIRTEFSGDSQLSARFAREALATGQIEHPHVVSAMDFGTLPEGGSYLVIQLVRGHALTKYLTRGALPWQQAAELGAQIADALAAAHSARIIHRDLKPDNVLIEERDGHLWAKVVDFGIAHLAGGDGTGGGIAHGGDHQPLTRAGVVIGTPGYMAPEQAVGGQVDGRVDLYALGVMLWEMCTGRRLWTGDSLAELFQRQLTAAPSDLRVSVPGIPPALAALVVQLLDPAPAKRPATPSIVRDELRSITRGEDIAAATVRRPLTGVPAHTMIANVMTGERPATSVRASAWDLVVNLRTAVTDALPRYEGNGRRVWWALGAGLLVMFALVARCACGGDDDVPAAPTKTPSKIAVARPPDAPATPTAADEPAAEEPQIPAAFAPHADILLTETNHKARRASAEVITSASESEKQSIPLYVRNLAWLEKNSGCEAKKPVLAKIEADDDPRVVPALRLLAATPRDGCREWFSRYDCIGCLREDLQRILGKFESRNPD